MAIRVVMWMGLLALGGCNVEVPEGVREAAPRSEESRARAVETDVGQRQAADHARMREEARLAARAAREELEKRERRPREGIWSGDPWEGEEGRAKPWDAKEDEGARE